jgi:glutaredoxin
MSVWRRMLRSLGLRQEPPVTLPVTFYTRAGCHLCEQALELLREASARFARCSLDLEVIDVDGKPELLGQYGDKVPVLVISGKERLWGKVNPVLLRRTLEAEVQRLRKATYNPRSSADGSR